jgi:uncharacterized protein involved in type VI secretion and phage assembly
VTEFEVLSPVVKISGALLTDDWVDALVDMRVELGFRVAGRCTLRFADPDYKLASSGTAALGKPVEVHARDKGVLMSGDITGVTVEHRIGEAPELLIIVHDKAHQLARATKVKTFVQMSYSDVVRQLAQENGLTPSVDSVASVLDYLMQVDSDLALLDSLADRTGYDWWVEGKTLHFKKPATGDTVNLKLADDLLAFSVRASGLHADKVRVDGWDRHQQATVTGTATSGSDAVKASGSLVTHYAKPGQKLHAEAEVISTGVSAISSDEATALSQAILDRAVAAAVTARGVLDGDPRIKPGICVQIEDAGPIAGKYHVTQVEHIFRHTGFETRFVAGDRRPNSLVDTLAGGTAGANASSGRSATFHHAGLLVGEVTNINDPESVGRVKVRFPGLSSEQESGWARVLTMGGGKSRGMVFLPEVGDEVLVGFEGGDLRQPVVLGGLYGSKSTIPKWDVASGKVNGRRITSRLGHIVELADGDAPATQHVLLQLAGEKSKLRLGKDKVDLEVPSGVPVVLKSGQGSITIGADGSITLKGTNIVLEAEQKLSMSANAQAELKGTAGVTIQSSGQTAVKGSMVQVEGSGMVEVKGGMVQIN